ncbi:MAG: hydrogenase maturation protease [bacterium]
MKTIVLGMGNTILSDDGVGIHVARELKKMLNGKPDVEVSETHLAGLNLVSILEGHDRAIVIDAIETAGGAPGTLHTLDLEDFASTMHLTSPHGINLYTAVEMGRRCGMRMPEQVTIFAVEVDEQNTFSDTCTPLIENRIPEIAEQIFSYVKAEEP